MIHYLNNAGAGLMSADTLHTIKEHLDREVTIGANAAAAESKTRMEEFYERAAHAINASNPDEIAFVDSASRAWNLALWGFEINAGDRIVTLSSEFGTNLITLFDRARISGASVDVIPCDPTGHFDLSDLKKTIERGATLVAVSHAAAHASIVNPVVEIGSVAKQCGALYFVDGCQAVGQLSVDVQTIKADVYTATGRKWLRGPRGTGFLYVRRSAPLRSPQLDLSGADLVLDNTAAVIGVKPRDDARQFELWERSVAGMLGLSHAIGAFLQEDASSLSATIRARALRLREAVSQNHNLVLCGDPLSDSGVVGFYLKDPSSEQVANQKLASSEIGFSTMRDWDCPLHFPSTGASAIFRLSAHNYTPSSSVDVACGVLAEL